MHTKKRVTCVNSVIFGKIIKFSIGAPNHQDNFLNSILAYVGLCQKRIPHRFPCYWAAQHVFSQNDFVKKFFLKSILIVRQKSENHVTVTKDEKTLEEYFPHPIPVTGYSELRRLDGGFDAPRVDLFILRMGPPAP